MLKTKITDGGREKDGFTMERNDCAVRAVAISAAISYREAHQLLAAEGRRSRRGTKTWMTERAIKKAGAKLEEVTFTYLRQNPTLAEAVHRLNIGRYLIITRGHALTLIDGVIHDAGTISGPRSRVRRAFRVTPAQPEEPKLTQTDINEMWERLKKIKF